MEARGERKGEETVRGEKERKRENKIGREGKGRD